MASEGSAGEQGGRRELYGFRKGNGNAYDKILAARNQYGQGSAEEFEEVSKAMSASAKSAGALNFSDPGKQGAITSLAHMRGSSGAQAILNSMESGRIVKADTLTPEAIAKIESMSAESFQDNLLKARVEYDRAIMEIPSRRRVVNSTTGGHVMVMVFKSGMPGKQKNF